MAHYAYISNEKFTVADRARLEEARGEKDAIIHDNMDSDGYKAIKNLYQGKNTSDTLEALQSDLRDLWSDIDSEPSQEEIDALNASIQAEKDKLKAEANELLEQMEELANQDTEDLTAEIAELETSIANTPYVVTKVITGVSEVKYISGDSTAQQEEIKVLEESKKDIEYNPIEDEYPTELQAIDDQIQALIQEIENIPQVEVDNTLYWEGWYRHQAGLQAVRRMSYNTQGGVHKLGGTPFRKNYAGIGYMYDPVRDAFYTAQPYPSWTLNEDTCYWEAPTPKPDSDSPFSQYTWNEETLTWEEI